MTVFYELPAGQLRQGVSTADAQDVLGVQFFGGEVHATVYTPRPDDPDADEENRGCPESRMYRAESLVELAVFPDTATDLSRHPKACNRRVIA